MDNPKSKKLTIKEQKFVKAYVDTGEKKAAYIEAYDVKTDNQASIHRMAVETSSKPHVKEAIEQAMVKLNLTPDRALKPVDDALNSEDLDMRLKGHDRYVKLVALSQKDDKGTGNTFIFSQNANFNSGKYLK